MNVPFLDIKAQNSSIASELSEAMGKVMESAAFAGGPFVKAFEDEFAAFCGVQHAVGVSNGTAALWAVLMAMGVGPGDAVITVPNTFIATVEVISLCGATPIFVDVEPGTWTMDPAKLEQAICPRVKAILPVQLYGQMADMDAILNIADKHGISVVEDAAQAHGAAYNGRRAGSMGTAGCFSFYPGKNLGACGEGGAVVTDDAELAAAVRRFREHGQSAKYYHDEIGFNARLDGLQGAVLSVKLKQLEAWNQARRENAAVYMELLDGVPGLSLPRIAEGRTHIFHLFTVQHAERDALIEHLQSKGVACGIHYPVPIHLTKAYAHLGVPAGSFPVAEQCARQTLSLPMFPELAREQIEYVAGCIKDFVS
ncbi:DegT/DnrJ/EryC1/StrS family aminotransferase [Oceanidesulfovibrio marinus]|uniref:DegT/DnrJ/EryC1/StrS family aminotransferase n=1 Tax=Oceanidesulfovibrio marinus TaxID=370038 RepID=A0ABX6NAX2_9BACT|nr:DegT/DnrJ/EryC1/StrS family aminotransferase [Oceanidesulfovibrio marinus]QJT07738.1 DegT/DnrJ/EryC1/StrS family aminotransferase [Oceanidesulfovibrio marinus]